MVNKEKYGEVFTPQVLVEEMYANLMKESAFMDIYDQGKIKNIFEERLEIKTLQKVKPENLEI